jgi:hypothetical protein
MSRLAVLPLVVALVTYAQNSAAQSVWSWVRVESGIPNAVVMQGAGITKNENQREIVVLLTDSSQSVDNFEAKVTRNGSQVTIEFQPPNADRHTVRMPGFFRVTRLESNSTFEEYFFSSAQSGQFFLLTRLRNSKRP